MYFKAFEDYIESLAISHKDLRHGLDGRVSFARLSSDDAMNSLANSPNNFVVIIDNLIGGKIGSEDDNKDGQTWYLTFLGYYNIASGDPTQTRDDVIMKTWMIMMSFISRMKKEAYEDSCGALKGFSFYYKWKYVEDMQLQSHYGFELTLKQTVEAPEYDASDWL